MARLLKLVVLMVIMSSAATSHPFGHQNAPKHNDFEWNSRKIGSRRVATIRIRKDEERDRRSIILGDDDDDEGDPLRKGHHESAGGHGRRRHAHRHHHGGEAPDAVWLTPEEEQSKAGGRHAASAEGRRHRGQEDIRRGLLSSRHVAESTLENRGFNDIQPEEVSLLMEPLDDAGVDLSHNFVHNVTATTRPRGRKQRGRKPGHARKRTKNKKKKNKKKKSKKGNKNKGSKVCRGLKGRQKKDCRNAFKKCRRLRGRDRKRCRAQASEAVNGVVEDQDIFSFINVSIAMNGSEACQYHQLAQCCKEVGLLTKAAQSFRPVVKCHFREKFLECMEEQRQGTCDPSFHTTGNMTVLRNKIKEVIWTNNSCLISEVEEG